MHKILISLSFIILSFSLANAEYTTRQQLADKTASMGNGLENFCKTQMAQTPEQLAEQYGELRARNTLGQEKAFQEALRFCISKGYISKDILK